MKRSWKLGILTRWWRVKQWWCGITRHHVWAKALDEGSTFYLCSRCGHEATEGETEALLDLDGYALGDVPWLEDA